MTEEWRAVPTYQGRYEVSNIGRVRRVYKYRPVLMMTPQRQRQGYLYVKLWDRGQPKQFMIHRLVVWAFDKQIPVLLEVNHKNGNKSDNRWPDNLEIITRSENQYHCNHVIKTRKPQNGSKHGMALLDEAKVLAIRARADEGCSSLARAFGVSLPTVSMILNRKTWRHI